MDSGFAGGEDEIYNVYDQAWRGGKDMAQSIYRPSKNLDKDMYGDDLEARIKTNRFVPDKEFSGSDRRQRGREGPVQFEEDPFGLDKFWKKPNSMVALKDPQIAAAPRNMSMKARRGGRSRQSLFIVNELLPITLMMQVIWGTLCKWSG